jgi:hypothetical protein
MRLRRKMGPLTSKSSQLLSLVRLPRKRRPPASQPSSPQLSFPTLAATQRTLRHDSTLLHWRSNHRYYVPSCPCPPLLPQGRARSFQSRCPPLRPQGRVRSSWKRRRKEVLASQSPKRPSASASTHYLRKTSVKNTQRAPLLPSGLPEGGPQHVHHGHQGHGHQDASSLSSKVASVP